MIVKNAKSTRKVRVAGAVLAFALNSVNLCADETPAKLPADLIISNARVYTVNPAQPWAEVVAIAGDRIVYVGDDDGVAGFRGEHTTDLDLKGKTLVPGFISAHDHLTSASWMLQGVHLFDVTRIDEAVQRVGDYARAHPEEPVIRGIGWMMSNLGRYPTAAELDRAVPDRPVFLIDYTGHDAWLNSAAMRAAGIDRRTPDLQPGTSFWVRDDEGNPTGVGVEGEWMSAFVAAGAWEPERMLRESAMQLYAIAASHGTTSLQDPGLVTPNILDAEGMKEDFRIAASMLAEMNRRNELPLRVQVMPIVKDPNTDPAGMAEFAAEMKRQYDSDMLRVRSVKIHPAANMESYGSPMIEPYADKDTRGHFGLSPELIRTIMLEANDRDIDVVMHVWGDAEVRAGIDAIEATRDAGHLAARNSLHHIGFVHPDDYQRIVDLDIPLNVTPMFSTDWAGQDKVYQRLVGEERVYRDMARFPDFVRDGVNVSISADAPSSGPFETQAPLFNVASAITLRAPIDGESSNPFPPGRQGMTLEQALRAVTIDAAWQLRMEDRIGSIETGKYADLAILDQNPFEVEPYEIQHIRVLGTILGGQFTHRDGI